ncbi:MAG: type II toxin-antitoxin system PemK/MazF family toxin [Cellulosilyticaceae bacterium]
MAIKINDAVLKPFCENSAKKGVPAMDEPALVKEFLNFNKLMYEYAETTNAYELASSLRTFGFWHDNRHKTPSGGISKQREVYYVDLGGFNLKWEEGFIHPCVVLKRYGTSALVIPGSTKSYGKSDGMIKGIQAGDGFRSNTGLMLDQMRCVSTTRILSKIGKVTPETYQDILDLVMEKFLSQRHMEFKQLENKNKELTQEVTDKDTEISTLNTEIDRLKAELEKACECSNN